MKRLILNDRFILFAILLNSISLYCGVYTRNSVFQIFDDIFTIFFLIEVIVKVRTYTWKGYWSRNWNRFDFIITMMALPTLVHLFLPSFFYQTSFFLCVRLLRVFKIFRLIKFIPNVKSILSGLKFALKSSIFVIFVFILIIFIISIILCGLYRNLVPDYFDNPMTAIYTTFRLFTVEGWYEIPDAIASQTSEFWAGASKVFFCLILFFGGIIGMSIINSIFVDAMVSDNNDDVLKKLEEIKKELQELKAQKEDKKEE